MKKVLLVTSDLDNGGAEKWVLDTITHMDRTGLSIDSYYWGDVVNDTFIEEYENAGVKLYFEKIPQRKITENFRIWCALNRFISEHGPYDAIHVNGTPITKQLICMHVAKKHSVPVRIVHSQNSYISRLGRLMPHIHAFLQRMVVSRATCVAACSQLAGKVKYGSAVLTDSKFNILRNGIDIAKFAYSSESRKEIREELSLSEDALVVLNIWKMASQKNQLILINVFKALCNECKNANLIIIGDGMNCNTILEKANLFGIDKCIRYIAWTDATEKYFSAADVFLFPNQWDDLGYVLLEAQANGLPCVVSDVVPKEVNVTGTVKFLSSSASVEEWVRAIKERSFRYQGGVKSICNQQAMILRKLHRKYVYYRNDYSTEKGRWPLTVLRIGIETSRFTYSDLYREQVREELNLGERLVILHVGRMEEQKNHLFLLEIFEKILKMLPDSRLLLIGEGSKRSEIIERIQKLNMQNNVILLSWQKQLERYYSSADVFLFPSLFEGLPIAALEAQTNGLPCYFSDAITREADITGNCYFLSLDDSPEEWAEIILNTWHRQENAAEIVKAAGHDLFETAQEFRSILLEEREG